MVNKLHENVDLYDNTFGEPTTEVVSIQGVIDFLDNVIEFTNKYTTVQEDLNNKYNLLVDRVVMTKLFERAVKELSKKNRSDVLKELKDVIIKLGKYEISSNKKNHPLKNAEWHLDLHLDGGNLILLYKYFNEEVFEIDVYKASLERFLRLQDIVNHKQLSNYDIKKYRRDTKEPDIDSIYKD